MKRPIYLALILCVATATVCHAEKYKSQRPAKNDRLFVSTAVESKIKEVTKLLENDRLAWMFANCFPNTLDTTIHPVGDNDTFVYTGDIAAMWLRDSGAQVWPYLTLINEDPKLKDLIAGVILRQFKCICLDPYANAFYKETDKVGGWSSDITDMKPGVHERKWEIDSHCYPIRLAYAYWKESGDSSIFSDLWIETIQNTLKTFHEQQRQEGVGPYTFMRKTARSYDSLSNGGLGTPVNPVGLIVSSFRPSDDACTFPFNVPGNIFASDALAKAAQVLRGACGDDSFADECEALSREIKEAVREYAVFDHPEFGRVYAYEIDGYGGRLFMDDANAPSLLSIPYLCDRDSYDAAVWEATRRMVLSKDGNPWFFRGAKGEGVGSPHTGYHRIWPMSIAMRTLVSSDKAEMAGCISALLKTTGGKGAMHESFDVNDDRRFSRGWFAWADGLFAEAVIHAHKAGALR